MATVRFDLAKRCIDGTARSMDRMSIRCVCCVAMTAIGDTNDCDLVTDVQDDETDRVVNDGYEMVPVGKLVEHPANPRRGRVDAIEASIIANGFYGAVVAQRSTGHILGGNHRFQAAQLTGMEKIPVIWADVDDATAKRILLADNRTNDIAGYDDDALLAILEECRAEENLLGTGYDDKFVDDLLKKVQAEPLPDTGDADDDPLTEGWGVIVECDSESQQMRLLEQLNSEGLQCRALIR